MKHGTTNVHAYRGILIFCFLILIFLPVSASGEETYQFERMWPTLQQPWYFNEPQCIVVDASGYVYVADAYNDFVQKFTPDGAFVTEFGEAGSDAG